MHYTVLRVTVVGGLGTGFSWFSPVLCQLGVIIYGYQ